MIQVNELRIGNLVHSKLTNVDFYVTGEYLYDISNEPNNVKPIPLTEKWLLEFGFEKHIQGECYILQKSFKFRIEFSDLSNIWINYELKVQCKYVHQLQNIFFVLTGKELEYETQA